MNDFVREFFEDQPELLRRYERNEARYILQLPKNYDTISIDFGIDKNEMKRLVIALAELDLTIDEWLCFKMKELITDFSPYYGPGIIAIDACTAFSGKVNCLVIED